MRRTAISYRNVASNLFPVILEDVLLCEALTASRPTVSVRGPKYFTRILFWFCFFRNKRTNERTSERAHVPVGLRRRKCTARRRMRSARCPHLWVQRAAAALLRTSARSHVSFTLVNILLCFPPPPLFSLAFVYIRVFGRVK